MGKAQWIALGAALAIMALLYFGLDTKPRQFRQVEMSRQISLRSTDVRSLLVDARAAVHGGDANRILALEKALEENGDDVEVLRQLSSAWFALGQGAIAGHYATEVALREGSADAWSIAGTTYSLALRGAKEEKVRRFCLEGGVEAFEKAISLEADEVRHRINLALLYSEFPPENNPMQGILMLVDLHKQYPGEAAVLFHLGRLAIQTGQTEKAVERLQQAATLRPDHLETWLLLASALETSGDLKGAREARLRYETLIQESK
jgi:Flp pilus assembly protein TadD